MQPIRSVPGLKTFFSRCDEKVKDYFGELLPLLEGSFSLDVALAYVFARLELAHNNCLYCGIVKLHKTDAELTWRAVQKFHMTREGFREKFEAIYGRKIPEAFVKTLLIAEGVRDNVLHGKGGTDEQKRNAIAHVLEYATKMNEVIVEAGGPKSFADLRGFKGRGQSLEKKTSRWVLKGMGFPL